MDDVSFRLPQRSLLAVPAISSRFLEKAAQSGADAVFIDLADAVAPASKTEARGLAIDALNNLDWGRRTVYVRVNGLDTAWGCRDILDVVEAALRLDCILLPKCEQTAGVHAAAVMVGAAEQTAPRARPVGVAALIETACGVAHAEAIAEFGGRLTALVFGGGDYLLDLGSLHHGVGTPSPDYAVLTDDEGKGRERHWNDLWHFAMARIANAARAAGLVPIDGPFTVLDDVDGLTAATMRAAVLGFEGKMAIHPLQLDAINRMFSPSAEQVAWAREVMAAMTEAASAGQAAIKSTRGEMIDLMHVKRARRIIERADEISDASPG